MTAHPQMTRVDWLFIQWWIARGLFIKFANKWRKLMRQIIIIMTVVAFAMGLTTVARNPIIAIDAEIGGVPGGPLPVCSEIKGLYAYNPDKTRLNGVWAKCYYVPCCPSSPGPWHECFDCEENLMPPCWGSQHPTLHCALCA